MQDSVLNSPIFYTLALTLIHFVWQGCLVAGMLKILLSVTSYGKAHWRYIYACGAMLVCLILLIITFTIIDTPEHTQFGLINESKLLLEDSAVYAHPTQSGWYQNLVETLPYVSLAWFSIVVLLTTKLIIELFNVSRLPYIQSQLPNAAMQSRFEVLVRQMSLKVKPRLLLSLKTKVPMAIGWLKPVVLIPTSMISGLTPSQLDMLILHELAHIRRHDYLVNLLQTLVEILLFFHPAIRWISKQMRNEREYCSDDLAVSVAGDPLAYARTLADTASLCTKNHRHNSIPSMAMAASGGDLKQRVIRLVDTEHHCAEQDDSGKWLATVLIIFTLLAVAIKPFLVVPLFDLSAGRISLFSDPVTNHTFNKTENLNTILPSNSIAQSLLAQNEPANVTDQGERHELTFDVKEHELLTKATVINPLPQSVTADLNKLEVNTATDNTIQLEHNQPKLNVITPTTPVVEKEVVSNDVVNIQQFKRDEASQVIKKEQLSSTNTYENRLASAQKTTFNNAYSKQIEELSREPLFLEQKFAIEKSYLNTKKLTVAEQERPKFAEANKQDVTSVAKITKTINAKVDAKLISSVEPKYPSTAKRKGLELDILVSFTIDKDGYVKTLKFERKNKASYFRGEIKSAMEKWRFIPATVNGERVESHMSKIFSFSLMK